MKNQFILTLIACFLSLSSVSRAERISYQQFSPEEFRKKQQEFITEKAELTPDEVTAFFPLYFEWQDKKKELHDQLMKLMWPQKTEEEKDLTEKEYKEKIEKAYQLRAAQVELEKKYHDRFKKILSYRKIYLVQKAELRFHRELLVKLNKTERTQVPEKAKARENLREQTRGKNK